MPLKLLLKALEALAMVDRQYPDRYYLKLWQGKVQGKTQTQLAVALRITQGAVSKRWQELVRRLADRLRGLEAQITKRLSKPMGDRICFRSRSEEQW